MIIILVDPADACVFPLSNKIPEMRVKLNMNFKDGAITLDAIFKTSVSRDLSNTGAF